MTSQAPLDARSWDRLSNATPTTVAAIALTMRPVAHGVGSPGCLPAASPVTLIRLNVAGAGEGDRGGGGDIERVHSRRHRDAHYQVRRGEGFGRQPWPLGSQ